MKKENISMKKEASYKKASDKVKPDAFFSL